MIKYPLVVLGSSLVLLYLASVVGDYFRAKRPLAEEEREDFNLVLGATLTLLGLLIGFTFSMATTRYDQRKNYEEAEANAIGTEYVRADLLPSTDGARVRDLLKQYTDLRILFYTTRDGERLKKIDEDTSELQNEMWAAVLPPATAQPNAVVALTVSGMNDVLNSQGYTQAAWRNRIPSAAWALMFIIALVCNLLIGHSARKTDRRMLLILPVAVSVAFFLIADIDSPRRGLIPVHPQNLVSLSQGLRGH